MTLRICLASGEHPAAGWINLDVLPQKGLDLRADCSALPFADGSADALYAGHIAEHIPLDALPVVLAEWRRVLRAGGTLMLVGPDIDRAVRTRQPEWLLDAIIAHGEGPGGHAWTCSEPVLLDVVRRNGWEAQPVPVASVTQPEWPNPSSAEWQLAVACR